MNLPELPADIAQFISQRIDSVPELEALLMMREDPREWSAAEIAARTYVPAEKGFHILDNLQRRRLVARNDSTEGWRYAPGSDADRDLVTAVAQVYRANVILIAKLIHEKASGAVREFARAFDLKKDR